MVFLGVVVSSIIPFVFNDYESIIIEKFRDFNGEKAKLETDGGDVKRYQEGSVTKFKIFAIFVHITLEKRILFL